MFIKNYFNVQGVLQAIVEYETRLLNLEKSFLLLLSIRGAALLYGI